jgi:PKD repeat protein
MTATTNNWNSYSVSKQLVLKPTPQSVKITSSIKKAPVWQWIDFSSSGSEWHITSYRWDFGDGNISTEANPTHIFSSPWKYKVVLRLEFTNRNVLENNIEIEIY